jgi:hypothetical protein
MDDIVALKVIDAKGAAHFILTWGRIFDRIDTAPLEASVRQHASQFGIRAPRSIVVCRALGAAARATYFYEAFFHISQEKIPFGLRTYEPWRRKIQKEMMKGLHLFYCGTSKRT